MHQLSSSLVNGSARSQSVVYSTKQDGGQTWVHYQPEMSVLTGLPPGVRSGIEGRVLPRGSEAIFDRPGIFPVAGIAAHERDFKANCHSFDEARETPTDPAPEPFKASVVVGGRRPIVAFEPLEAAESTSSAFTVEPLNTVDSTILKRCPVTAMFRLPFWQMRTGYGICS
eukprot:scaffold34681_cov154-Amphora_coffeaeformis.AAC.1